MPERVFDRIPHWDPRNDNYNVRTLFDDNVPRPRSYTWPCKEWVDQGYEGSCVGHAFAHELIAYPKYIRGIDHEYAVRIYDRARQLDEWEGEDYEGTSVLAGAKSTIELSGKFSEYRWVKTVPELIGTVGRLGPVVMGTWWYEGMLEPDYNGLVRVEGQPAGGHSYLIRGISLKNRLFRIRNSWGPAWGKDGDCFVSFEGVERLLGEDGEACVPLKRVS